MGRKNFDFDIVTLLLYLGLVLFGWMAIYAVTFTNTDGALFDLSTMHGKQIMWVGISLIVALVVLSLDNRFIEAISYFAYGAAILMLILVLFIGKEVNGAKSWLIIAGQPFQPSEFAKMATALALARYMSRLNFSLNNTSQALVAGLLVIVPGIIVILQNDTGSALVFASFLIVFFREGLNPFIPILILLTGLVAVVTLGTGKVGWIIAIVLAVGVLSFLYFDNPRYRIKIAVIHIIAFGYLAGLSFSVDKIVSKLPPHQQIRIKILFDPGQDPRGAGYNVIQSKIAIGSGGVSGKGYLDGNYTKYKFVPKQETDFIYCTVGEEFGWLGTSTVLIMFFLLIVRLLFLAENSKTRFARIYGYSVLSILFFHVFVNVGMTIGLVPVIGIPLPFFSYGGSSLLSFTVLIFLMVNLYSYRASVLGSKL
ncbi:MAG: rod shape-determining protein RodA [Bacteroidia bacterium]